MRGFRTRSAVEEVVALIDGRVGPLGVEGVGLREAAGRALAESVASRCAVPGFDRAASCV